MSKECKNCGNPECECEVNEEAEFCSNACAESDSGERCHCKHSDCRGDEPPAPQK